MLKHCRPDILARGHLSLLHRFIINRAITMSKRYWQPRRLFSLLKIINTINCSFYWLGCTCSSKPCKQGKQRWQIPRPATCQCLATFTPLKSKILIFFRDVISLLARVFILLIDTATQDVPMKNIWKKLSFQLLRYAIELLHVKRRTRHKWR